MGRRIGILFGKPIVKETFGDSDGFTSHRFYYGGEEITLSLNTILEESSLNYEDVRNFTPKGGSVTEAVVYYALIRQVPFEEAQKIYCEKVRERKVIYEEHIRRQKIIKCKKKKLKSNIVDSITPFLEDIVKKKSVSCSKEELGILSTITIDIRLKDYISESTKESLLKKGKERIGYLKGSPLGIIFEIDYEKMMYKRASLLYKTNCIELEPTSSVNDFAEYLLAWQRDDFEKAVKDFKRDEYWNTRLGKNPKIIKIKKWKPK